MDKKLNYIRESEESGDEGAKPPARRRTKCDQFQTFCYNKEDETICNRTPTGWCRICSYYAIFVFSVFALFMSFVLSYIHRDTSMDPAYDKSSLFYLAAPGASMFPGDAHHLQGSAVWYTFKKKEDDDIEPSSYIRMIKRFLDEQVELCNNATKQDISCYFNRSDLGPCANEDFGYKEGKPCIYLKLNRLAKWVPFRFTDRLPDYLPAKLKEKIVPGRSAVWVHCDGTNAIDRENLGKIVYYPEPSYHENYFPTSQGAPNPLIAIKLDNLRVGYVVSMKCELHANNIVPGVNNEANLVVYVEDLR